MDRPDGKPSQFLRRRYRQPNRRRVKRLLMTLIGGLLVYFIMLGDSGFLRLHEERREVEDLRQQLDHIDSQRSALSGELEELQKTGSLTLERVAREQYGMLKDGERTIHIIDEDLDGPDAQLP